MQRTPVLTPQAHIAHPSAATCILLASPSRCFTAQVLAMFIVAAEEQGVPADKLQGTIQNDILKARACCCRAPVVGQLCAWQSPQASAAGRTTQQPRDAAMPCIVLECAFPAAPGSQPCGGSALLPL